MELDNIRRLRFFKIYRHDKNVTVDEVTETIKKESDGPGQLLGYRAVYHKIRQVHDLNVKYMQPWQMYIQRD